MCANHKTGDFWALLVIEAAQGRGHDTKLLDAMLERLRWIGHRQSFLTTGANTRAAEFYRAKGRRLMDKNLEGEAAFV